MEKDNIKKANTEIDEEMMMNLMVDGVRKEGLQFLTEESEDPVKNALKRAVPTKPVKAKKVNDQDYEGLFLKKTDTNARDGKTVYIRPDFHEKLTRIVQVIGEDKITVYAYLDNVLEYHFKEFGEQITTSYNDKYKPIL